MIKKVSIIIPCFNSEKFIQRCLDSILEQTYKSIELILINDGSTDNTEKIIQLYSERFNKINFNLIYIYQEHFNQSVAINKGLKIFSGDYLCWMDSDDWLTKDSIEKKVNFLENNKQYGMVRSSANLYKEDNLKAPYKKFGNDKYYGDNIFKSLIIGEVGCSNGRYMMRRSAFLDVYPDRTIYESPGGQNWQILIPVAYKYRCGYIDKPLFNCLVRNNSHSREHINKSIDIELQRVSDLEDILINILDKVFNGTYNEYYKLAKEKFVKERIRIARKYKDLDLVKKQNKILESI